MQQRGCNYLTFRGGDQFCDVFAGGLTFTASSSPNILLKMGADRVEIFESGKLLGVPGPTKFQKSLFSHSGAFEKSLNVSPRSLSWTSQQIVQASCNP